MAESYRMQYDEQGRVYFQQPGQPRRYVSPVALGQSAPADTTGIYRSAPRWNQNSGAWETPVDWSNVLSTAVAGGLTAGGLNAVLAGGPAASGGSAAASSVAAPGAGVAGGTSAGVGAGGAGVAGGTLGGGAGAGMNALLPIMGISAGANLGGAYLQSRAANNAAKTQAASADKALAFAREIYGQQRSDTLPWLQAGQSAVAKLSGLLGLGGVGGGPISQPANQAAPFAPGVMPRPGEGDPSKPYYRPAVTLTAPDGSTKQFDEQMAAQLLQRHPELRRMG